MSAFARWVVAPLVAVALVLVAGYAVGRAAALLLQPQMVQPQMVPCAQWTQAHQWCQGPADVTP